MPPSRSIFCWHQSCNHILLPSCRLPTNTCCHGFCQNDSHLHATYISLIPSSLFGSHYHNQWWRCQIITLNTLHTSMVIVIITITVVLQQCRMLIWTVKFQDDGIFITFIFKLNKTWLVDLGTQEGNFLFISYSWL